MCVCVSVCFLVSKGNLLDFLFHISIENFTVCQTQNVSKLTRLIENETLSFLINKQF